MRAIERREQLRLVVVGHVDHGKSTIIGRLLAESGTLPKGKLEQVQVTCRRNAKPFEYAFLLDALKDEQAQGITIDATRCFFRTPRRDYLVLDAPGHVEFLKNMITGASDSDAALVVIDAHEGIQENSKRHGYLVSMLGVRQLSVLVNKMDLVGFDQQVFESIRSSYAALLRELRLEPLSFIPLSGRQGVNVVARSPETPWYTGPTLLEQIETFQPRQQPTALPFRFPVQDIYKFTEEQDERRIVAGTIETGRISVGDEVIFYPSGKRSRIRTIEVFNAPTRRVVAAGEAPGFTLEAQVYIKRGELMARAGEQPPQVSTRFLANLFWMGHSPMIRGKTYKLKIGAARSPVKLAEVRHVLDASELSTIVSKQQVDRHDVAECVLECPKPVAFDTVGEVEPTARLVIVDNYEIAGAGIVLEVVRDEASTLKDHVRHREIAWRKSSIAPGDRAQTYGHRGKCVVFTGQDEAACARLAEALERSLFARRYCVYHLGMSSVMDGLGADLGSDSEVRDELVRRLGELARIMTDAGLIFIVSLAGADEYDLRTLELLNQPHEIVMINVGENDLGNYPVALNLDPQTEADEAAARVCQLLQQKEIFLEYYL